MSARELNMSIYTNHLFICTNIKENNNNCCGVHDAKAMLDYAKQKAKQLGLTKEAKFRVSSSGCMGRCSLGPVMVVYPAGTWYRYSSTVDIDNILDAVAQGTIANEYLIVEHPEFAEKI